MNKNTSTAGSGIGISGLLGVAFVILKLTNTIDWSWVWVTAPFWGPVALALAILLFAVIIKAGAKFLAWLTRQL